MGIPSWYLSSHSCPEFICHRHWLVAGKDCWILPDWGGIWPELLHWSGLCWWCLCPCWTAWASCSHIGDNGKWGSISRARGELAEDKGQSFGLQGGCAITIKVHSQDVMVVKEFVYLGSLIHSTTGSTCDISRRSFITRTAMQSLENQIWRSRLATSTKLKLYNTCILPVFLHGSDCWAISKTDAHRIDALD